MYWDIACILPKGKGFCVPRGRRQWASEWSPSKRTSRPPSLEAEQNAEPWGKMQATSLLKSWRPAQMSLLRFHFIHVHFWPKIWSQFQYFRHLKCQMLRKNSLLFCHAQGHGFNYCCRSALFSLLEFRLSSRSGNKVICSPLGDNKYHCFHFGVKTRGFGHPPWQY